MFLNLHPGAETKLALLDLDGFLLALRLSAASAAGRGGLW